MSRIGAVLGPQLNYLQRYWAPTPFVGFTGVAIINFLSVFFLLPETSGTTLPDSLNDPLKKAGDPEEQAMLQNGETEIPDKIVNDTHQ